MSSEESDHYGDGERPSRAEERKPASELRVLEADPRNAEAPSRAAFRGVLTSCEHHYVRNHYSVPDIDAAEWTISLTGRFGGKGGGGEISMAELRENFSTTTVAHTMGCSGNGRAGFEPTAGEHQWSETAVGTALWTGTPVREVLEAAGVDEKATWLSVMGGDAPEGEAVFTRSIPMAKIRDDCLLAYEMNGAPLPADHGFPVRLLVPGWFGNNSVKWVSRLHAMDSMVHGSEWDGTEGREYTKYQQESYRIIPSGDEEPRPYSTIDTYDTYEQLQHPDRIENAYMLGQLVHSLITTPGEEAVLDAGGQTAITGVTWAGSDPVDVIEISTDGGETWREGELFEHALGRDAWRRFRYAWDPEPGEYTLVSRATSEGGQSQPLDISEPEEELRGIEGDTFPWNEKGYGNNAARTYAIDVTVE